MTRTFLACVLALLGAGCVNFGSSSTTSPTADPTTALMSGQWTSVSSTTTLTNTCTDFHWMVTTVTASAGSGTFTARCMGTLAVAGNAQGTLSGTSVTWTANATGTSADGTSCPVTLSGTAAFDGTQFRVPYTGTTCLGPVTGAEILRQN